MTEPADVVHDSLLVQVDRLEDLVGSIRPTASTVAAPAPGRAANAVAQAKRGRAEQPTMVVSQTGAKLSKLPATAAGHQPRGSVVGSSQHKKLVNVPPAQGASVPVRDAAPSKASGMREASSLGKRTQHEIAHLEALRRRQKRAAANGTANTIPPPASLVRSVVSSTRPSPPRRAADTLSETRRATTIGGPRPPSSAETSTALERMPPEGQPSDSFGVPLLEDQVERVIGALHQAGLLRCDSPNARDPFEHARRVLATLASPPAPPAPAPAPPAPALPTSTAPAVLELARQPLTAADDEVGAPMQASRAREAETGGDSATRCSAPAAVARARDGGAACAPSSKRVGHGAAIARSAVDGAIDEGSSNSAVEVARAGLARAIALVQSSSRLRPRSSHPAAPHPCRCPYVPMCAVPCPVHLILLGAVTCVAWHSWT